MDRRKRGVERCGHGSPVVVDPVPDGRKARCLVCGQSGPVRQSSKGALAALVEGVFSEVHQEYARRWRRVRKDAIVPNRR